MPVFNELGLVPPELPNSLVPVSSGDDSEEKREEDSEATMDDVAETSPPSQRAAASLTMKKLPSPRSRNPRSPPGLSRGPGSPLLRRLGRATPKKGEVASLPLGYTPALPSLAAAPRPAVVCPTNPQGATKPALRKICGALATARKRAYIAADE